MPNRDWTWPRWKGSQTWNKMGKCPWSQNVDWSKRNKTAWCGGHRGLGNWWRNYMNENQKQKDHSE